MSTCRSEDNAVMQLKVKAQVLKMLIKALFLSFLSLSCYLVCFQCPFILFLKCTCILLTKCLCTYYFFLARLAPSPPWHCLNVTTSEGIFWPPYLKWQPSSPFPCLNLSHCTFYHIFQFTYLQFLLSLLI